MQMAQRTVANKPAVSGVQRSALLPARPRSVVVRYRENNPESAVKEEAQKLADQANKTWSGVDKNLARTEAGPGPVSELERQSAEGFLKRAGGKPIYDEGEPKYGPWTAAFSRRREIFAGRLAMVGLSAACFWEYILPNHPNITQQIGLGLQLAGLNSATSATGATLIGLIILQNVVTALSPWSPSFTTTNLQDISKRPQGPPTQWPNEIGGYFGIAEFGAFSKANELFNGRLAMLGFLAAVVQQLRLGGYDGPGTIAQVAEFLGTTPDSLYLATPVFFAVWPLFWTVLAFVRGKFGSIDKETEIY